MADSKILNLGPSDVMKAMNDQAFLSEFPEFRALVGKAEAFKGTSTSCSSCRKKAIARNVARDFLDVLKTFQPEQVAGMKKYFNTEQLMYQAYDPKRGSYKTVVV